ncbi:MAG: hypothetical protein J2P38_08890, partial [Candidatus Dormibacteraeota bacterium]|nr:hypothetical protein [Candidatus Dormibacteraeota bacterium]
MRSTPTLPKVELHVHLEGTIRPHTLLSLAGRNGLDLPARSEEELAALYDYRDFAHFIDVWILTTNCLRTADDFRQVVVDYATEAASCGAVYLEGIFSPAERVATGVEWDALFNGYCALAHHPLPRLVAAGVPCSVSTDDPAMFGTDL